MTVGAYYDATTALWDTEGFDGARALAAMAASYGGRSYVLDVGCGMGNLFPYLLRTPNSEIVGLDVSGEMLRIARERFGREPRILLRQGAFEDWEEGGFDSIVAFNAYHHFLDPAAFVERAAALLSEGGRLTVAYGYGTTHLNNTVKLLPPGLARELRPISEEMALWSERFAVDCYLDSADLLLLSGVLKNRKYG